MIFLAYLLGEVKSLTAVGKLLVAKNNIGMSKQNFISRLRLLKSTLSISLLTNTSPPRPAVSLGMSSICELFQSIRQKPSSKARKPVLCSHVTREGLSIVTAEADNSLGQKGAWKKNWQRNYIASSWVKLSHYFKSSHTG